MSKAIVLLSGGQDSTTCLYWALKKFTNVSAIGFDYGQSHKIELEKAKVIAKDIGIEYKIINTSGMLASSSLTNHTSQDAINPLNKDLPASFTAGRNLLFITIAASLGAEQGVFDIVTGVCQTDFNGYPDCRRVTIDSLQTTLSLGLGVGDIRIHTPLMYLSKAETWKLAKELDCLNVIIEKTMTDYSGSQIVNEWGFGDINDPATKLRASGYFEAKQNGWL